MNRCSDGGPPDFIFNPLTTFPTRPPGGPPETYSGNGFLGSGLMLPDPPAPGVPPNNTFTLVMDTPGTYEYVCILHPSMIRTITVVESNATEVPSQAELDAQAQEDLTALVAEVEALRDAPASLRSEAGPDGTTIWRPDDMPGPLMPLALEEIPGVGRRMEARLERAGIYDMAALLATQPKQLRKLWRNVTGERLWYALHGYDVQTPTSGRGMFGHGRVLPPTHRSARHAEEFSRLLLVKAARRMRREGFYAGRLWLWLSMKEDRWFGQLTLPIVHDDMACLSALKKLWKEARADLPANARIIRIGVTLLDLSPASQRQLDLLLNDDVERRKWERITHAVDHLNTRYGRTIVSLGKWTPPPGGNAGGKISYTRIPRAEDFW